MAKVERHPGELYPRVDFNVTNLSRPGERVTRFYDGRGTAEQYIKEGKNAINWTSPEEYRAKWSLPFDYPMTAPKYAETRSKLAKKIGLGRKPGMKVKRRRKA